MQKFKTEPDVKTKIKLGLNLLFFALETEVAWNMKDAFRQIVHDMKNGHILPSHSRKEYMVNDKFSQPLPNLPLPFDMIPVEGGTFDMGDEHGDLPDYCRPVHQVKVSGFYIGKYPVTQAVWKAVMNGENPSRFQSDDRPVEQVSWEDVQGFIKRLNDLTRDTRPAGHFYRLPTEAEWEFAARGGKYFTEGYKYAGSDRLKDVGWFADNSGRETKPAGQKQPNQLGIYDMSGNVWEWCEDWFGGTDYYEKCRKVGIVADPQALLGALRRAAAAVGPTRRGIAAPPLATTARRALGAATLASALLCPCRQMGAPLRLSQSKKENEIYLAITF
ncbi:MAG: formylglycine-generating enzyme family protein [Lewinellaceae bacterium]|nr:formylglycine-generating enzyme family protein [Lewinellaceae bacterium]